MADPHGVRVPAVTHEQLTGALVALGVAACSTLSPAHEIPGILLENNPRR